MSTVNIVIDGINADVVKGKTILETARFYGINIPTACYYEGLSPYGACRICSVEVSTNEGKDFKVVASCTYEIHRDVIVKTDTPKIRKIKPRHLT